VKITLPNGTIIELSGVEELATALPALMGESVSVEVTAEETAEAPAPAPTTAPPTRRNFPTHRIDLVYITPHQRELIDLLRAHPGGLTSREIAQKLNADDLGVYSEDADLHEELLVKLISSTSGHINKLMRESGLIRRVGGRTYVLSDLGLSTSTMVTAKPWLKNRNNRNLMRYLRGLLAGEYQ
jgi:hypothetical protein